MPAAIVWTQEITDTLFDRIIVGDPICAILKDLEISQASFYRHRLDDADFERTIARAQEMAQEANIDRTEQLALSATSETWQLVQFQCRNMQWIAGKRKPKKYSERLDLNHSGDLGVTLMHNIPRPSNTEPKA
jgi:hypothetical protein